MTRPRTRIKIAGRRTVFLPSVGEAELLDALDKCDGNKVATAQYLGVSRATVYNLMARYGIVLYLAVKKEQPE